MMTVTATAMVRAAIAAAATLVTMVIPVVSAVVVAAMLFARASSVVVTAVVRLLVRALAAVRRVVVAVTIATVVMVVLFFALVFDIDFGAELDIGVDFRVIVFLDIDVTVHDGAVVIAVDVHVSSVAHATLAVSLTAAAAAGGLALFADVLDTAGQVLADGGHDGVDRHDGLKGFHEDLEDRLNEADPLGDLTGDLRLGGGS